MDNVTAPFVVRRMAGAIGAEIGGVKLHPDLPGAVIAELRRLWLEHLVLFFRNQELTPQGLAAVARRFGEVVHYPFLKGLDEAPEVIRIAKLEHETVNFGGLWHTDTAYLAEPPMATMLIAREGDRGGTGMEKLEQETVNFGGLWHPDPASLAEPPMATMLIAREVPPYG